jgi:hypothetical protein
MFFHVNWLHDRCTSRPDGRPQRAEGQPQARGVDMTIR